ncbi:cyanophycinase [Ferruginivarius sediminum]|uniref:Cyanophycinase n=1 Tax=Ferruginivarius sediminum TaxID=2661937 RepID=A0A369T520_9PROT|nr:cyanophycinase [Ferruginivarius sediminum]RDD60441.1 cyanophycinase [Ferruginivarius sediminum]
MANKRPGSRGHIVAIGGAEDKSSDLEVLSRVFSLAPRNNTKVLVIATASGYPEEVLPAYQAAFGRLGASEVHALNIRNRKQSADQDNVEMVKNCGVVFFTGGDQLRLTHVFGGSPVLDAIRERYMAGAVIAGTSAGAVAMSATMIYNGSAADALRKGAVSMTRGFGFVEGVIIDSHFLERGRFTRLMEAGTTNPELIGVGLGEDAGVIFYSGNIIEAIGPGHVIIVDSGRLARSNVAEVSAGAPVAVENMLVHALIAGYGYDIKDRRYMSPEEFTARIGGTGADP